MPPRHSDITLFYRAFELSGVPHMMAILANGLVERAGAEYDIKTDEFDVLLEERLLPWHAYANDQQAGLVKLCRPSVYFSGDSHD